jgi:FkbM family methyltransferase
MAYFRQRITTLAKNIARDFGVEVSRYRPDLSATAQIVSTLKFLNVDLVIDVGANKGQFAQGILSGGFSGSIVSFEPLSEAHLYLSSLAKNVPSWHVHDRCAVGAVRNTVEINISGNSVSSSILPMLNAHQSAAPQSAYVGKELVNVVPLDEVIFDYDNDARSIFLKVDTQGFEWQVLDGAEETLKKAKGVLLELSLVPLYDGQRLWKDMFYRLENLGFSIWALQPGFTDPASGRTLQMDAIFVRT